MKAIPRGKVSCYGISAKEETNLDAVLEWLINRMLSRGDSLPKMNKAETTISHMDATFLSIRLKA